MWVRHPARSFPVPDGIRRDRPPTNDGHAVRILVNLAHKQACLNHSQGVSKPQASGRGLGEVAGPVDPPPAKPWSARMSRTVGGGQAPDDQGRHGPSCQATGCPVQLGPTTHDGYVVSRPPRPLARLNILMPATMSAPRAGRSCALCLVCLRTGRVRACPAAIAYQRSTSAARASCP
jgi:hypothetical protein